jgi:hypothetical protein
MHKETEDLQKTCHEDTLDAVTQTLQVVLLTS